VRIPGWAIYIYPVLDLVGGSGGRAAYIYTRAPC
jgi:hypothetical protein